VFTVSFRGLTDGGVRAADKEEKVLENWRSGPEDGNAELIKAYNRVGAYLWKACQLQSTRDKPKEKEHDHA
jgi:hypothetical protein